MDDTRVGLPEMTARHVHEQPAFARHGALGSLIGSALLVGGLAIGLVTAQGNETLGATIIAVTTAVGLVVLRGLVTIAPGEARVLQFFGRYVGTVRAEGLRWVNPFASRRKVSTRVRNHETATSKVNDADGNPIEIAAVVVWRVEDTAQALFEVDSFVAFVEIQTETAVRHIATSYPYDNYGAAGLSLRENADEITERLSTEIGARVRAAGVRVIESRLTHLAFAPEIAQAMLQRQQAGAVVAARERIVEGAVGMVEMALDKLAANQVVELDEERKATMVSNLLVVLCGDRSTQPVVNAGSLYR
ncbi:MAG TPA: SPFH domain-containing protein [Pseudonocardiaceae bacterium]|jgi:regulator of protease activity HflC (stomatin/prohibitin superfamily)|nr:SPFH domain-containing protein [Pseudonocardiaceae bacterium]